MKKFFYDSWIAKKLLIPSCHTITIGPFIFSKKSKDKMDQKTKTHECIHVKQWCETCFASGICIGLLAVLFDLSVFWMLFSLIVYYVLYGLEWIIRFCITHNANLSYDFISFEQEATNNEDDENYIENSSYFSWIKYFK